MSQESEHSLKLWIRDFAKKEGRKPQVGDMPDATSASSCTPFLIEKIIASVTQT